MLKNSLFKKIIGAIPFLLSALACANDYPNHPIKWIVPYLAGTAPDLTARIVAPELSRYLKQPIVVENRGGAGGNIGAQLAARARPDGYTLVILSAPMATNMKMYSNPGYDVLMDFIPIGRIVKTDLLITVNSASGFKSLDDLMAYGKAHPGSLSYGSGGVGSPAHVMAELLLSSSGVKALHIPFKGANEAIAAVMGHQIDFTPAITASALPLVQQGKLGALATTNTVRSFQLPNVPTVAEAGFPTAQFFSFTGLGVTKGSPPEAVAALRGALKKAMQSPELKSKLESTGAIFSPGSEEELERDLQEEIRRAATFMNAAKLSTQ